jgi:hypothetical protein
VASGSQTGFTVSDNMRFAATGEHFTDICLRARSQPGRSMPPTPITAGRSAGPAKPEPGLRPDHAGWRHDEARDQRHHQRIPVALPQQHGLLHGRRLPLAPVAEVPAPPSALSGLTSPILARICGVTPPAPPGWVADEC